MALGGDQDVKKPPGPSGSSPSFWDSLRHWTDRHWSTRSRPVPPGAPGAPHCWTWFTPRDQSTSGVHCLNGYRKEEKTRLLRTRRTWQYPPWLLRELVGCIIWRDGFVTSLTFWDLAVLPSQGFFLQLPVRHSDLAELYYMFAHRVRVQTSTTNPWQKTVSFGPRINQVCWLHQR